MTSPARLPRSTAWRSLLAAALLSLPALVHAQSVRLGAILNIARAIDAQYVAVQAAEHEVNHQGERSGEQSAVAFGAAAMRRDTGKPPVATASSWPTAVGHQRQLRRCGT